jgi:hypothetical protein
LARATFATGSKVGVFSLTSTGDHAALSIDPFTGEVTVNASPDFETKSACELSVKETAVTDDSSALAIGDSSVLTNGQSDNTSGNALLITFSVPIYWYGLLVSENFSIDGTALDSGLTTNYKSADKVLIIAIGDAAIDVDATDGAASTIYASSRVKALTGPGLDTLITGKVVDARTGILDSDSTSNLTYNTVKSPDSSVYWLDRNLDATQVATSATDAAAFGSLYQWGRPADGHQIHATSDFLNGESTAGGTDVTRSTIITPSHNEFITGGVDWVEDFAPDGADNNNGSDRSSYLSKIDGSGICPASFRVPTPTEWSAATGA